MAIAQTRLLGPVALRLATLKNRSEFVHVRKGGRVATSMFVLEARRRGGESDLTDRARVGFTVSKKVGTAVERNRIKRRLRAAVRDVIGGHTRHDFDYVLIARRAALDSVYAALVSDLTKALKRIHAMPGANQLDTDAPRGAKA